MHRRRVIACICMLCALAVSAFAAQAVVAATSGTTAFTCKEKKEAGGAGFSKVHCEDSVGTGAKYEHLEVPKETTTDIAISNETTGDSTETVIFTYLMGGIPITFKATGVTGAGWMTNAVDGGGQPYAHGEGSLTFTGVTTTLSGCKIYTDGPAGEMLEEGVIHTEPLVISSQEQGDNLRISPKVKGAVLAKYYLAECTSGSLNGTNTVRGSIRGVPRGATLEFTHVQGTQEATMTWTGGTSGTAALEGALTIKARDPTIAEDVYTPLSATTVEK